MAAAEGRMVLRDGTGGIARGTQNAVGRVIKDHPIFLSLYSLLFFRQFIIYKIRLEHPIFFEKFCLIHNQIALHRET